MARIEIKKTPQLYEEGLKNKEDLVISEVEQSY